jgi:hypothetical protein
VALGLSAWMFGLSVRDELHPAHTSSTWMFFEWWHGWLAIAANVAFYVYLCWVAFGFVYGTKGWERLFFVGLFGFLLSPLKTLGPEWAVPERP